MKIMSVCVAASAAILVFGCTQSTPSPTPAGRGVSDAEKQALFEQGRANAEKNAKVTRRPRRFSGDSI